MPIVYTIIVTYNGLKWYDRCIGGLMKQSIKSNIVVIDNASSDNSVEYIRVHYPMVHLISSNENLGFAKANNVGMRYALDNGADYILLINQDAWFKSETGLQELIENSENNHRYWIVAPLQVYASSGRIERETEKHLERSCTSENDFISDVYQGKLKDIYPSEYSCAYCWILPRKTVETIGGFDPLFYHYGEDDNYQQRVRYHGGLVGVCPKVEVFHDVENRPADYREKNLDWKKYLLIKYCDINLNWDIEKYLKETRKKLIIMFLRLQKKHIRKILPEYKYFKQIKNDIKISRSTNKYEGSNWLE